MPTTLSQPSIVIRAARGSDTCALVRLAELDSAPALLGPALVAEVEGRVVAALEPRSGNRIADPFVPTAGLLSLLELRAAEASPAPARRGLRRLAVVPGLPRATA